VEAMKSIKPNREDNELTAPKLNLRLYCTWTWRNGLSGLTYYSRPKTLNLDSLEVRRLPADMVLVYKILFGLVHVNSNAFFTLSNQPRSAGSQICHS